MCVTVELPQWLTLHHSRISSVVYECVIVCYITSPEKVNYRIHVFVVCVHPPTSNSFTPRRHFPKHKGHGVNVSLFKGLDVVQIQTSLQHLRGHVTCRTHLQHRDTRRGKHTTKNMYTDHRTASCL